MTESLNSSAISVPKKYGTVASRWAGIGPYYAMFPTTFADEVIAKYTAPNDLVLDPFAGRGTAVFSAAVQGRSSIGVEISPLGFVYANAKLKAGSSILVRQRLAEVINLARRYKRESKNMPYFFHRCFTDNVRRFLLAARANLNWRHSNTDRTLMALILTYLHGKREQSLSNQMRQSTAMAPDYSVRWWDEKKLLPPDVDPLLFFDKRITWRYAHGAPNTNGAWVYLGDSVKKLPDLAREITKNRRSKASLMITSPPYHNIVNYYYDQWIRIWLLGGPETPNNYSNRFGGKFSDIKRYRRLLERVFNAVKPILTDDAILYVRTDKRESTLTNTRSALCEAFPEKEISEIQRPLNPMRKVKPYSRGGAPKRNNCEIDIILKPR